MTQSRVWAANLGNTVRTPYKTGATLGSGANQRFYVGRHDVYDYDSFVRFALDWTDVRKIVSATLCILTDDGQSGIMPLTTTETPKIFVRRLLDSFGEGTNRPIFVKGDVTVAAGTTSDQKIAYPSRASGALNQIDITAIVEDWAPTTVQRRNGKVGGKAGNYGLGLLGTTSTKENIALWSEDAAVALNRPYIDLVYEQGATKPNAPTSLTPAGEVASVAAFEGNFTDSRATDLLSKASIEFYSAVVTNAGQVISLHGGKKLWSTTQSASNSEIVAARFNVIPSGLTLVAHKTYKWRARVEDNEKQTSPWTNLVSITLTAAAVGAPTLTPASASAFDSLNGVLFRGGEYVYLDGSLLAYQIQLSAYAAGNPNWDDATFILWDTGKVYVPLGSTNWESPYGGDSLDAGTYYWRARVWDSLNGVSAWAYASIVLTADFDPAPGTQSSVQIDPIAPWRIVIKAMHANGHRGPGAIVAVIENAKSVGASLMYNSPGELHFTLPVDHPQISVIEPKQTHYSLQTYSGDGWREIFAGLIWDFDATEQSVIFYGIDYLGLFDYILDERYDASNIDLPAESGGSKYVNKTITQVVTSQIDRAIGLANSPVDFITRGTTAAMTEKVTIWSTMEPTLRFVSSLLDSHKQGTGKKTRLQVVRTTTGSYETLVEDDPGVSRNDLRMKYGELVQGYRVIPFGPNWASVAHVIGRTREGVRVFYKTASAPGINQAVWGRIAQAQFIDGVSDEKDLARRVAAIAIRSGKLGTSIGLAIRSGILGPFDGYNICDSIPVEIIHGAVNTTLYGSDYWTIWGVAWEVTDAGETNVILTIRPREDTSAPDTDLIPSSPLSPQPEWQIGYVIPGDYIP